MLGTILYVDGATRMAVVRAEDGKRYTFAMGDLPAGVTMVAGDRVDFDIEAGRAVSPLPYVEPDPEGELARDGDADRGQLAGTAPHAVEAEPSAAPIGHATTSLTETPTAPIAAPAGFDRGPTLARGVADAPGIASPSPAFTSNPAAADTLPGAAPITPSDADGAGASGDAAPLAGTPAGADNRGQTRTLWMVIGGIFALILLALAYMMWDNRSGAGTEPTVVTADNSTEVVQLARFTLRAISIRSEASATGGTVVGELARGARVTGVEVAGTTDPSTRWLRIDNSDRYVPLRSVGSIAPPTLTQTFNRPMMSAATLAIHDQPAEAARVVETLAPGQPFQLFGQTATGWAEIGLADGSVGYTNLGAAEWASVGATVRNAGAGTTGPGVFPDGQPGGPMVGGKIVGPPIEDGPTVTGPTAPPAPRRIDPAPRRPSPPPPPRRIPPPDTGGGSGQSSQGGDAGGPSKPE